jgi:3-dehydroquinate dehydratase-2
MNGHLLVLLHGVNLDLLGERPIEHYGALTLRDLERLVTATAAAYGWECACYQTNHEGRYVEYLHEHRRCDALVVNPGAWTHYSYAIRDALELVTAPVAEVHLSDITAREEWRRHSVISEVVSFTVSGRGADGYTEAVDRLIAMVAGRQGERP